MRNLGNSVVSYISITNTELDWVMLFLIVSLDNHQGHDDKMSLGQISY